ncbi:MAG: M6 family metalloprotease domain-containing protein [Bacteroidaceae bacterium]|nr:M6 family metalloprotease domain-containing protein [Bacteroidaceae bacterium]
MKKEIIATLILSIVGVLTIGAVPAKHVTRSVKQPDGSTITIMLQGDEFCHYYTTLDGTPVKPDKKGRFIPYTAQEMASLQERAQEAANANGRRAPRKAGLSKNPSGTQRVLVVLAQYTDVKFSHENPNEAFMKHFNDENYSENGGYGSARDYFIAQSNGAFSPQFDVYGPYTVSHEMAYYGGNRESGSDKAAGEMVMEALKLGNNDINFKDYDTDRDGVVDFCYVIYAGYGEAQGGGENTIWPHKWELSSAVGSALKLDGVQINEYACSSELNGSSGKEIDGIGTICHEFSHCLGLPDFYDTVGDNFGMFTWSIMDYGCYNENGYTPCGYTAYEKEFMGWIDIETLSEEQSVSLSPVSDGGKAYRIESNENTDEYYIIENVQQTGWNRAAAGHGLLVMHVDYKQTAWISNTVNNYSIERMTIIPADAERRRTFSNAAGDPYPGTSNNVELTDYSTPPAVTNAGNSFGQPITEIKEEDGVITFSFMKGCGDAPEVLEAKNVTSCSFNARWKLFFNIESYLLEVFHIVGGESDKSKWNASLLSSKGELVQTIVTENVVQLVTNLEPGELYCYRLRCYKNGVLSAYSGVSFVQLPEDDGLLTPPTLNLPTSLTDSTFSVSWSSVQDATSYVLEYEQKPLENTIAADGRVLFDEDFDEVKKAYGEITRVMDIYTETPDWRGQEIHADNSCLQIGSEEDRGYLITPYLPCTSDYVTIQFSVAKFSTKDEKPILHICLATDADQMYYTDQVGAYITSTDVANYYCVLGPLDTSSYIAFISNTEKESDDRPMLLLDDITVIWGDIYDSKDAPSADRVRFVDNIDDSERIRWKESEPQKVPTTSKKYIETTDTSWVFENFEKSTYDFRVRAVKDAVYSVYSDKLQYEAGLTSFEVNGLNYELLSEEKKTVALTALREGRLYEGDIVVPETISYEGETYVVTALSDSVFRGCANLHSVVIPSCVSFAGSKIFKGCKKLTYVDWQGTAAIDSTDFIGTAYNTLVYVKEDVVVDSKDVIVIRDGVADSITVNLNGSFVFPRDFRVNYIEYVKDFSQKNVIGTPSGWETVVLPFDVQKVEHEEKGVLTPFGVDGSDNHFWIGKYNGSSFELAREIKANIPYVVSFPNSDDYDESRNIEGSITFSAENALVKATMNVPRVNGSRFDFVPVYEKVYKAENRYMLNTYDEAVKDVPSGGSFIANRMSLRTFGAYMEGKGSANMPKRFDIVIETHDEEEGHLTEYHDVYGVDGRLIRTSAEAVSFGQTDGLQQGVYIIGGRKYVVR